jgi:hypothetical protein
MAFFDRTRNAAEPVLFYARHAPSASWMGFGVTALLSLPLAFLAPLSALVCVAMGAALAALNHRAFRFELTPRNLRLRPGFLLPSVRIPLAQIASARADFGKRETALEQRKEGAVVVRLVGGREFYLGGVIDPAEAAEAIVTIKRGTSGPATDDRDAPAAATHRAA